MAWGWSAIALERRDKQTAVDFRGGCCQLSALRCGCACYGIIGFGGIAVLGTICSRVVGRRFVVIRIVFEGTAQLLRRRFRLPFQIAHFPIELRLEFSRRTP